MPSASIQEQSKQSKATQTVCIPTRFSALRPMIHFPSYRSLPPFPLISNKSFVRAHFPNYNFSLYCSTEALILSSFLHGKTRCKHQWELAKKPYFARNSISWGSPLPRKSAQGVLQAHARRSHHTRSPSFFCNNL